jgi:hypothetical protein
MVVAARSRMPVIESLSESIRIRAADVYRAAAAAPPMSTPAATSLG